MTVLVTGGTGLVGSRVLRHFVNAGINCRGLVRLVRELPAGVAPVIGDLFDTPSLVQAAEGVAAVVHLAAVFRTSDKDAIWRTNLDGTRNLVDAVKAHAPQARFLMASTGLVYSEDASRPGKEDDVVQPTLAYPASKVAAEKVLQSSGLNWSILRLPFVYGDGDEHLASIPKAVAASKMHPAQTFSMVHQRDVARAIEFALTGAMDGRIVNIADDAPTTLLEMAGIAGSSIEASSEPLTHPWWGRVDPSLGRSLGFRPKLLTVHEAARQGAL